MKYIFLNRNSCGGLAHEKWEQIQHALPFQNDFILIDQFYQYDWSQLVLSQGDVLISAGGDGTLHCLVNTLIEKKGIDALALVTFGHIGLGSNNSFLRPYETVTSINGIPASISHESYSQDLISIKINGKETVYCLANSSIGLLALANHYFNSSKDIAVIKRWNSDLADVFTFFKTLMDWEPLPLKYQVNDENKNILITNMHFMKRPYYATDLGFPEKIPTDNGKFRVNVLHNHNRMVILKRFLSMMLTKQFEQGRNVTFEAGFLSIQVQRETLLEVDGEIYRGDQFEMTCLHKGIQLCK